MIYGVIATAYTYFQRKSFFTPESTQFTTTTKMYLNKSSAANSLLEVQIKQPGDTRWNSSHLMFLTLIKNREVLDRALVGDDAEWITIYFLEKMLGQIAVC